MAGTSRKTLVMQFDFGLMLPAGFLQGLLGLFAKFVARHEQICERGALGQLRCHGPGPGVADSGAFQIKVPEPGDVRKGGREDLGAFVSKGVFVQTQHAQGAPGVQGHGHGDGAVGGDAVASKVELFHPWSVEGEGGDFLEKSWSASKACPTQIEPCPQALSADSELRLVQLASHDHVAELGPLPCAGSNNGSEVLAEGRHLRLQLMAAFLEFAAEAAAQDRVAVVHGRVQALGVPASEPLLHSPVKTDGN